MIAAPQLNPQYTFASFLEGDSNSEAKQAAILIAEKQGHAPLLIVGGTGLGKTHLAQAIAHAAHDRFPRKEVEYVTAGKFMHDYQTKPYDHADFFIIDDIPLLEQSTEAKQFFAALLKRYSNKKSRSY